MNCSAPKPFGAPKPFAPSEPPSKNEPIPSGDIIATKGMSAFNQQAPNPDKIPVCAKCSNDIR